MATEQIGRRPTLPPYPQLIFEAIDELNQKEGANKSAISKYIESKYGDLPAGHANLLSATLFAMKERGELVFLKNNYLKPDPNNPIRRGRGRPPKPKDPLAPTEAAAASGQPKSRGRPKKDPNAPPAPKKPKPDPIPFSGNESQAQSQAPHVSKTGRPRGRPRKVKPESVQNGVGIEGI